MMKPVDGLHHVWTVIEPYFWVLYFGYLGWCLWSVIEIQRHKWCIKWHDRQIEKYDLVKSWLTQMDGLPWDGTPGPTLILKENVAKIRSWPCECSFWVWHKGKKCAPCNIQSQVISPTVTSNERGVA